MRLATVMLEGTARWGVVSGDAFRPVPAQGEHPTIKSALAAGALVEATAVLEDAAVPLESVRWLPVVPQPDKILCVGLNYDNHRRETGRSVTEHPTYFTRFADSQIGHGAPMILPRVSDKLDYEGELAIVIGRGGRAIGRAQAMGHVAGYTCYNDGSVRDWQWHTTQFIPGKNFPGTGAFGPWLVTADEFGSIEGKSLRTRLNGEVMQQTRLEDMIFAIPELIEYASAFTPLSPGDVIVTGTPGGVGAKREPPVFMKAGDRVTVEIDGVGSLSNTVQREA